jgi:hypothetical protein
MVNACFWSSRGKTWYLPFDMLEGIPRVGESIQVDGNRGRVAEIEYEFMPVAPPLRMGGEEMPVGRSYARPVRVVVKAS